ncbi:hypothetical protein CI610_02418 [invertebrate metagenome]|uniref:Flagellar protein n=1 Tax=invertebrate metagenome TaxID=1711999 RepID=A0A2H9T5Z7_9ZZZZ
MPVQWILCLLLITTPAFANGSTITGMDVVQLILPMIVVVLLIFALAWLVRKIRPGAMGSENRVRLITHTSMSSQAKLCLVHVGNRYLLLGVTNHNVRLLETFDEETIEKDDKLSQPMPETARYFSQLLKKHPKDCK